MSQGKFICPNSSEGISNDPTKWANARLDFIVVSVAAANKRKYSRHFSRSPFVAEYL